MVTFPDHQQLLNAIPQRHSRRSFDPAKPVSLEMIDKLKTFATEFRPFDGIRTEVKECLPELPIFKGIVGGLGKASGAPIFAAVIVDTQQQAHAAKAGIIFESFVLKCTELGLGTCWIAGTYNKANANQYFSLKPNEKILSVTPIGYPVERKGFGEKMLSTLSGSHKRRSLSDIVLSDIPDQTWVHSALENVRIAPSAVNRQPWLISYENNTYSFFFNGSDTPNYSKAMDVGIAIAHFLLTIPVGKNYELNFHSIDFQQELSLVASVRIL
ncbi:hypothetical protein P9112_012573 [Eukaryota sp. TZLM1-RC]